MNRYTVLSRAIRELIDAAEQYASTHDDYRKITKHTITGLRLALHSLLYARTLGREVDEWSHEYGEFVRQCADTLLFEVGE